MKVLNNVKKMIPPVKNGGSKMKMNRKPQRIAGMIVVIILLSFTLSCLAAVPPPDSAPAEEEVAAEAPQAEATSIASMAILKIASLTNPDGTSTNTASLSINSLGVGTLELDTPEELDIHDTATVSMRLALGDEFASLPESPDPNGGDLPADALRYTDQIDIYPVMNANLVGSGFEITASGSEQKVILSNTPVEWLWSIKPKETGSHSLRLVISIPVIVDEERDILSTHTLQNIPVKIEVTETFGSKLAGALPWLIPTLVTAIGGIIGFILNARRKK
jgi:hypothetical protein